MLTHRAAAVIFFIMGLCGLSLVDGQILHGRVLDAASGKPISGANLMIEETTTGTATVADGTFSIPFPHVPAVLVVSHLSYKTSQIKISSVSDSLVEIMLDPASYELTQVDIAVNKVVEIMKGTGWEVLDFEFLEDNLLLMANPNGNIYKPSLLLVNMAGDTIASLRVSRPGEFYRDFEGNIDFLNGKSAFKVAYRNDRIYLDYLMDHKDFMSLYPVVIDVQDPYWMLQQYSMERLKLSYYRYNVSDSTYNLFCSITDQPAVYRLCRGAYFDGTEADYIFATRIMNHPVEAPMFRTDEGYLVFNFVKQTIECYSNEGSLIRQITAPFMKDKQCKSQIYRDRVTGEFYALYEKNGRSSLYLISPETGTTRLTAQIPDFVFVENIIIRNSEAFFLYKDKCREEQKKIFRMKL